MLVGLPGVLWVLPDSYIDVKNKDYGGFFLISTLIDFCSISYSTAWLCCSSLDLGDKYINGEIIPCKYPTYQPKRSAPKNESRRYERRRDGPPPDRRRPRQEAAASDSSSTWGCGLNYLFHSLDFFGLPLLNWCPSQVSPILGFIFNLHLTSHGFISVSFLSLCMLFM